MLLKPFVCYATGVLTTALAVSMGCGRWGVICYALGLMSALIIAYSLLRRPKIARLAIKLLTWVSQQPAPSPIAPSASKREIEPSGDPEMLESAFMGLKGLGCRPSVAKRAAVAAVKQLPTGSESQVLKLAIQLAR